MDRIAEIKASKVKKPQGLALLLENAPEGVTLQRNSPFPLLDYLCWCLPEYLSWPLPYTVQYKNFFIGVADRRRFKRYDISFSEHVRAGVEQAWAAIERAYQHESSEKRPHQEHHGSRD